MARICRDCGSELIPFDVHLLDEVQPDVMYAVHFSGWSCPYCQRLFWHQKEKPYGGFAAGAFPDRAGEAAA